VSLTINLDRDKLAKYIPTELDFQGKGFHWTGVTSGQLIAYRRGWLFAKSDSGYPAFKLGLMPWSNLIESGYAYFSGAIVYLPEVKDIYVAFAETAKGDYGTSFTGFHLKWGHMHFEDDATNTDVDIGAVNAGETWLLLLGIWNDAGTKKVVWWAGTWNYSTDSHTEKGSNLTGITTNENVYTKQFEVFEPNAVATKGGIAGFVITKRIFAGDGTPYKEITNLMKSLRLHGLPEPSTVCPF